LHCTTLAHIRADLTVDSNCPNIKVNPPTFAVVTALVRRKNTLFVGGYLYRIGGQRRDGLAAVSNSTGKLLSWNPGPNPGADIDVTSLSLGQHSLYVAGMFTRLGGKKRFSLGAVDVQNARATAWDPRPDASIHGDSAFDVARSGPVVYVAGDFAHLGRVARPGFASVSARTGLPLRLPRLLAGGIDDFAVDPQSLYVSVGDPSRLYRFDSITGSRDTRWAPGYEGEPRAPLLLRVLGVARGSVYVDSGLANGDVVRALDANTGALRAWTPPFVRGSINTVAVSKRLVLFGTGRR
jgi:hypothetical protein